MFQLLPQNINFCFMLNHAILYPKLFIFFIRLNIPRSFLPVIIVVRKSAAIYQVSTRSHILRLFATNIAKAMTV